jgi:hypothetical protein
MDELLAAGMALCREGRFEAAIGMLKEEIRRTPARPELHQWLISAMVGWARNRGLDGPSTVSPALPPARISVIVCSINAEKLARLRTNLRALIPDQDLELIHVPDARSMCEGYNRGARRATSDILVFCHDDIEVFSPDFARKIADRLRSHDVLGVAGATRLINARWESAGLPFTHGQVLHRVAGRPGVTYSAYGCAAPVTGGMQALDGLLLATRRDVWLAHRFDEENYPGFHLYDVDFVFRCHLAGADAAVCTDILVEHQSLGRFDAVWARSAERFLGLFHSQMDRDARPGAVLPANFRLNTVEQAWGLFHAMQAFGYGADIPPGCSC